MLKIHTSSPSPDPSSSPHSAQSLADLSRNASVISSSSSSSSTSDLTILTPPRPVRTFSSPRSNLRSRSPVSPTPSTPRSARPPAYLARELGLADDTESRPSELRPPASRQSSKSRASSVNGRTSADDFEFGRVLGEGSYSTVMLARNVHNGQEYAIKLLDKGHLKRNNKLQTALAEKNTLVRLGAGHPGIVRLHSAFQDEWSLFFVLDLARNGELQARISRLGSLSTTCARYYAAQIVDALDYMHTKGVIHRDLKPENLLLDDNFRIKITDFGTGKIMDSGVDRAKTFVGTAQYVSPELLESSETSKSSDFWALGCIIYQMIAGRFAFQGLSEYLTWQKIKQLEYGFPEGFDEQAKDLVQKLLVRDPAQRLGAGEPGTPYDMAHLRAHPFFAPINWATLWTDPAPPLEPGLVKKEHRHSRGTSVGQTWEDVGATWDDLVDGGRDEDDDIGWASDEERVGGGGASGEYKFGAGAHVLGHAEGEVIGPMGERRPMFTHAPSTSSPLAAHEEIIAEGSEGENEEEEGSRGGTPVEQKEKEKERPVDRAPPNGTNGSHAPALSDVMNGSPAPVTSPGSNGVVRFAEPQAKSEGATDGEAAVEADERRDTVPPTLDDIPMAVRTQPIDVPQRAVAVPDGSSTGSATSSSEGSPVDKVGLAMEAARGRNRAQTPIQGNARSNDDVEWAGLLQSGETVLFNTSVETSALRRRASRLLAMAVTPRRKTRELVLTDRRLFVLKHKPGRPSQIRLELLLRVPCSEKEKEREKETRRVIVAAEQKGEKEFAVLAATKTHCFLASSASLANTWVRKIREAIETHGTKSTQPQASNPPAART